MEYIIDYQEGHKTGSALSIYNFLPSKNTSCSDINLFMCACETSDDIISDEISEQRKKLGIITFDGLLRTNSNHSIDINITNTNIDFSNVIKYTVIPKLPYGLNFSSLNYFGFICF